MKAKVLKHKAYDDVYGVFNEDEIYQSGLPQILALTATIDMIKEINKNNKLVLEQLDDYDLIEVSIV